MPAPRETVPGDFIWDHYLLGSVLGLSGAEGGVAYAGGCEGLQDSVGLYSNAQCGGLMSARDGSAEWHDAFTPTPGDQWFVSVGTVADGTVRFAGTTDVGVTLDDVPLGAGWVFVASRGPAGEKKWTTVLDLGELDNSRASLVTAPGGSSFVSGAVGSHLQIAGQTLGTSPCSTKCTGAFAVALDPSGAPIWGAVYNSMGTSSTDDVSVASPVAYADGGFAAGIEYENGLDGGGLQLSGKGSTLVRWDATGHVVWQLTSAASVVPAAALPDGRTVAFASADSPVTIGAVTLDATTKRALVLIDTAGSPVSLLPFQNVDLLAVHPSGDLVVSTCNAGTCSVERATLDGTQVWQKQFQTAKDDQYGVYSSIVALAAANEAVYIAINGAASISNDFKSSSPTIVSSSDDPKGYYSQIVALKP